MYGFRDIVFEFHGLGQLFDSVYGSHRAAAQRPLDDKRADDGRHPKIRFHFEVVDKKGALSVRNKLPAFVAEFEITLIWISDCNDFRDGGQEQVPVADERFAEQQYATFHARVKARSAFFIGPGIS